MFGKKNTRKAAPGLRHSEAPHESGPVRDHFPQQAGPVAPASRRTPQRALPALPARKRPPSSRAIIAKEHFTVEGIEVEVARKRVKNITLRIKDAAGPVHVSAPVWAQATSIEGFVREKKPWILKKRAAMSDMPPSLAKEAPAEDIARWRADVEAAVPALVAKWEPIMGVRHATLVYRNMTSRWGSCNPSTGRICINIQLANYPEECLEYVVVHELCHLLERGHGPRFKSLMTHYLPDWQTRRAKLRGRV